LGMLSEVLKESSYAELKRKAENRKEWRIWKPRTCLTTEHKRRASKGEKERTREWETVRQSQPTLAL